MKQACLWILFLAIGVPAFSEEAEPPWPVLSRFESSEVLPGSVPLEGKEDFSRELVLANDRFLERQIVLTKEKRSLAWSAGDLDIEQRRTELVEILGLHRDTRIENPRFEFYGDGDAGIDLDQGVRGRKVRWPVLEGFSAEGWLLEPIRDNRVAPTLVVVVPDADEYPEHLLGWGKKKENPRPYSFRLVDAGCRVLIPTLVSRKEIEFRMTRREWLHRPAFVLGRTLTGYELHMILAGADALLSSVEREKNDAPLGIMGWGEGGRLALFAAALDPRFRVAGVSGYFGPREELWKEPAEHNLFGFLEVFGDAELGALVRERSLLVETGVFPKAGFRLDAKGKLEILEQRSEKNGKPGRFVDHPLADVRKEVGRLRTYGENPGSIVLLESETVFPDSSLKAFLGPLGRTLPARGQDGNTWRASNWENLAQERENRISGAIERHTQRALVEAASDRNEYFSELKTDSIESFSKTLEPYRNQFRREVIGCFDIPLKSPSPRSRPFQVSEKTKSYEVVLDVFDEVIAYGILTVPRELDISSKAGLPVVVCQHGLEGTPQGLVGEQKFKAYQAFATRLAERGYVTFAPQNGYKYFDRFRLQQFKAQSIGKTLFSVAVPQHEQITAWLASLPFVDPDRIAFYGLSYGGKSAMRIPSLVDRYCLSICSGDFNEWVWKNAATDAGSLRYSYTNKGEYEIFEWNLGGTFNYAEMASLICPRPFMVERGHFDGVAPDERVAFEFAKVRNLYLGRLGLEGRCEIEWFPGPHAIHGKGTFEFLDRHLRGTPPK